MNQINQNFKAGNKPIFINISPKSNSTRLIFSKLLMAFFLVLASTLSFAQTTDISGKIAVGISAGFSTLQTGADDIAFWFVDESPSMDNIYSDFTLEDKYNPIALKVSLCFLNAEPTSYEMNFEFGGAEDVSAFSANFGAWRQLKDMGEGKAKVRLGGFLGYGISNLYLGDIVQNDLFIQINGEKYYGNSLRVKYQEDQITFSPQLQLRKMIKPEIEFTLNAGYRLRLKAYNGNINFIEPDGGEDGYSETVSLKANNIALYIDQQERQTKLFNQRGAFVNLGFGIYL